MEKKFNQQHYVNHLKSPNKQKLQQQIKEEITDCDLATLGKGSSKTFSNTQILQITTQYNNSFQETSHGKLF